MRLNSSRLVAATLGLAALAGCTALPGVSVTRGTLTTTAPTTKAPSTAKTAVTAVTTSPVTQAAPFVTTATTAAVTPASVVTTEAEAKAIAANDETMLESISAALEADEAHASTYSLASLATSRADATPVRTVLGAREARQPARQPSWNATQKSQLEERRTRTLEAQRSFERTHPQYATEADAIKETVKHRAWTPNADDETTLCREGAKQEMTQAGARRTVRMKRVIGKAKPHFLLQSRIELEETAADGSTKTIVWEKSLQADGSCHIVFHHEFTGFDDRLWVTDWEKTLQPDGRLSGAGCFKQCDRRGRPVREETVVIGGNDRDGQKLACISAPSPAPSPSATPSAVVSASPSVTPSVAPSLAPSPEPTATPSPVETIAALCRTGSVTGGGSLVGSSYTFGFGPQLVTINDVANPGVELKADVVDAIFDGSTATLTCRLRAPNTGTVTLVVTDNGEGENDPDDTVTFLMGATLLASGPLEAGQGGGNLQVHGDCE